MAEIMLKYLLNLQIILVRSNVFIYVTPTQMNFYGIMAFIFFISHLVALITGSHVPS